VIVEVTGAVGAGKRGREGKIRRRKEGRKEEEKTIRGRKD
jgi:hypothetical protein